MPQLDVLETKDPNDVVDYHVNWGRYLDRVEDTIQSSSWPVVTTGITLASNSHTDTTTTAWFSGGTAGADYEATNRIVTAGGRTLDRTITIRVRDR